MSGGERAIRLVLRGEVAEIRRLAAALEDFGAAHGIPDRIIGQFALASDELVTNTITYGGPDLRIEVAVLLQDGRLSMTIEDNGKPFDPFSAPAPDLTASLEDRAIGGLGVHIVSSLMDNVFYKCHDGLNKTTIDKVVTGQDATA